MLNSFKILLRELPMMPKSCAASIVSRVAEGNIDINKVHRGRIFNFVSIFIAVWLVQEPNETPDHGLLRFSEKLGLKMYAWQYQISVLISMVIALSSIGD